MFLNSLKIDNYKNLDKLKFNFNKKINCFIGKNGIGKTNIIDSIYHLAFTKSYFNPSTSQNVKIGEDFFSINGNFEINNRDEKIHCYYKNGDKKIIKKNGKLFKSFRGMGSVGAMNKGSADRYSQKIQSDSSKYVAEGVEGYVKFKGKVDKIIYQLVGGLKSSMGYLGSKKVINLRNKASFIKITKAGFYESMVHNLDEIKK